jgi:hypothetical protein
VQVVPRGLPHKVEPVGPGSQQAVRRPVVSARLPSGAARHSTRQWLTRLTLRCLARCWLATPGS